MGKLQEGLCINWEEPNPSFPIHLLVTVHQDKYVLMGRHGGRKNLNLFFLGIAYHLYDHVGGFDKFHRVGGSSY